MELRDRRPIGSSSRARERGTSMLEMVIVVPVLLLLVFGIAEFGVVFAQWQTLSNAAREGARVGVVFRDPADCAANALAEVETIVTSYSATVISAVPAISVSGLCQGSPNPVTVTATLPYNFQVLPGLAGLTPSVDLVATSVMRNE